MTELHWWLVLAYVVPLVINLPISIYAVRTAPKEEDGEVKTGDIVLVVVLTWVPVVNIVGTLIMIGCGIVEFYAWIAKVEFKRKWDYSQKDQP